MKIVKVYTYDTNPWRYARVVKESRCHHTGDSSIILDFMNGESGRFDPERIQIEQVLNVVDEDLPSLHNYIGQVFKR